MLFFFIRSHRQKKSYSFCQLSPAVWVVNHCSVTEKSSCVHHQRKKKSWHNLYIHNLYSQKTFSYLNDKLNGHFFLSSYIVHIAFMTLKARLHFHTVIIWEFDVSVSFAWKSILGGYFQPWYLLLLHTNIQPCEQECCQTISYAKMYFQMWTSRCFRQQE